MGDRRPVLDDQHPPPARRRPDRRAAPASAARRIGAVGLTARKPSIAVSHLLRRGGIDLVDDQHIGHAGDRLARMVGGDLARPQRVGHHDVQIGADERKIVVAAVPDDDVGLRSRPRVEDRGVVDAGEDQIAERDMRLVFLALFDGAAGGVEIGERGEALHALAQQIAVGHRVPQHGDPAAAHRASRRDSQRAIADLPQPVRTAVTAMTGSDETQHRPARSEQA